MLSNERLCNERWTDGWLRLAGPLIHAVVWNDGDKWLTALDTSDVYEPGSGKGLLADYTPLADFGLERQFGTFSAEDACNYGVHVYQDGNLLSVVVECGASFA